MVVVASTRFPLTKCEAYNFKTLWEAISYSDDKL